MASGNPFCQMCRKEICAVCKQKLDACKCPCPNFVICRYCEVHEKTMPPCDDMFPGNGNGGFNGGSGGFGGEGPLGKMMMPLMMMMTFINKQQAGGKSCQCRERNHERKERVRTPKRDRDQSPKSGHPCCCKALNAPVQLPMPLYPMPMGRPTNPFPHQGGCSCSSRGDDHAGKCREPINQYFFGADRNPQPVIYPAPQVPYLPPQVKGSQDIPRSYPQQGMDDTNARQNPPERQNSKKSFRESADKRNSSVTNKTPRNHPQEMNDTNAPQNSPKSPDSPPQKSTSSQPQYGFFRHKPVDKRNSIVTNKI